MTMRAHIDIAAEIAAAIATAPPGQRMRWLREHRLDGSAGEQIAALARAFGVTPLGAAELARFAPRFDLIPFVEAQRERLLAGELEQAGRMIVVVVEADPTRLGAEDRIERLRARAPLEQALAADEDFDALLARLEGGLRAMDGLRIDDAGTGADTESALRLSLAAIEAQTEPVVRLVDSTLYDALRSGASDIHLETQPGGLTVKYRIDGVLSEIRRIDHPATAQQALSRLKVLAELDISERRVPQDGRFKVISDAREIDFRVSIMPNMFGEDAVLRILDRQHLTGQFQQLSLDNLGFEPAARAFVRRLGREPYGMLLVTGPTGSGKTTTLYAALSEINTGLDKIVTIEDPIEYQLPGVLQIPVNERKGLTFAKGLRSILRHDPDKIMVGEIRDAETAQIAVQAALTGHQVFTTIHANSVFDVIARFANMGIDAHNLVAALNGVVAQRLLRSVCASCAHDDNPAPQLLQRLTALEAIEAGTAPRWRKGAGCPHCRGTGYKGRIAAAEYLAIDDAIGELLAARAPLRQLRECARRQGFSSMRQSALRMAALGLTTLEEVERVTLAG